VNTPRIQKGQKFQKGTSPRIYTATRNEYSNGRVEAKEDGGSGRKLVFSTEIEELTIVGEES
jgi:hypothetical protein